MFKNSELKITLLFVNIIVNTDCQHSKHNSAWLYVIFSFYFRLTWLIMTLRFIHMCWFAAQLTLCSFHWLSTSLKVRLYHLVCSWLLRQEGYVYQQYLELCFASIRLTRCAVLCPRASLFIFYLALVQPRKCKIVQTSLIYCWLRHKASAVLLIQTKHMDQYIPIGRKTHSIGFTEKCIISNVDYCVQNFSHQLQTGFNQILNGFKCVP